MCSVSLLNLCMCLFFRRDALKEQFGKEPSTVRCLAVKSALLGTRHPRKEKEAALQNVTGEPACLYGKIIMTTQTEMEPSIKIEKVEVRSSQPAGSPVHRASQGLLPGGLYIIINLFEPPKNSLNHIEI